MNDREAIERAARLQVLGVEVRSPSLASRAREIRDFNERGGNRAMRRAARKAKR